MQFARVADRSPVKGRTVRNPTRSPEAGPAGAAHRLLDQPDVQPLSEHHAVKRPRPRQCTAAARRPSPRRDYRANLFRKSRPADNLFGGAHGEGGLRPQVYHPKMARAMYFARLGMLLTGRVKFV
jgi:hypothetical protein